MADIKDRPQFDALSYAWGRGTPGSRRAILLNETHSLQMTDNLFAALRRLRRRFASRQLWIDAICINQDDLEERNHQVSMMDQVYLSAQHVCIWLGDCEDPPVAKRIALQVLALGISNSGVRRWRIQQYQMDSGGLMSSFCRGLAQWSSSFRLFEHSLCSALLSAQPR